FIRNPGLPIFSVSAAGPRQSKSPQRHRGHQERKTASFGILCRRFSPPLPQVQGKANHHRGTEDTKNEKQLHSESCVVDFLRLCRRSRTKQITTEAKRTQRTKNSFIRNPGIPILSVSTARFHPKTPQPRPIRPPTEH